MAALQPQGVRYFLIIHGLLSIIPYVEVQLVYINPLVLIYFSNLYHRLEKYIRMTALI